MFDIMAGLLMDDPLQRCKQLMEIETKQSVDLKNIILVSLKVEKQEIRMIVEQ